MLNPHIAALVCSRSGREVAVDRFRRPPGLCRCCDAPGSPLLVRYDAAAAMAQWNTVDAGRQGIWRYEALLPVCEPWPGYGGDVGRTPTVPQQRLGDEVGVELWIKQEGGNPSGSFKDRGLAVAIALGRACGAERFCLPTQGNAGIAASLFCTRLGLPPCIVYMPQDYAGSVYHRAAAHFGAEVVFHGANIAACGKRMRADLAGALAAGKVTDVSTFFEPGRLEGKKTIGLEIFEHFGADGLPDFILYPTGGGTGLVGIPKALDELAQMGLLAPGQKRPRMVSVQSERCDPVVRSFHAGEATVSTIESQGTIADGLDVPGAIMGHRMLAVLHETGGTAVAVTEEKIREAFVGLGRTGVSCGYEGAATLAGLWRLREDGTIAAGSRVLLLNTSGHAVGLWRTHASATGAE